MGELKPKGRSLLHSYQSRVLPVKILRSRFVYRCESLGHNQHGTGVSDSPIATDVQAGTGFGNPARWLPRDMKA